MKISKLVSKAVVKGAGFTNMKNRINYFKVAPKAFQNIMELEQYTRKTGLDKKLRELIKLRVSQINGCSFCIDMHTKAAKKFKASVEEIERLQFWKDSNDYSPKEKITFELAENVTCIAEKGVNEELYQRVREFYNEKEYVDLILIINQINMWNRISIAMGNTVND